VKTLAPTLWPIEQFVERQGEIAGRHEQAGKRDIRSLGALDGLDDLIHLDAPEHVVEHVACNADDGDADRNAQPVQDLPLAQNQDRPAYGLQHRVPRLRAW
jgi:hypothetical protein